MARAASRRRWALVAGCTLAAAGGAVAYAAVPAGNGTISACYQKSDGQLRVVDTGAGLQASYPLNGIQWVVEFTNGDDDPYPADATINYDVSAICANA